MNKNDTLLKTSYAPFGQLKMCETPDPAHKKLIIEVFNEAINNFGAMITWQDKLEVPWSMYPLLNNAGRNVGSSFFIQLIQTWIRAWFYFILWFIRPFIRSLRTLFWLELFRTPKIDCSPTGGSFCQTASSVNILVSFLFYWSKKWCDC